MKYAKQDFGRDLFFLLGFLEVAIEEHNKTAKNGIDEKRFEEFKKYCHRRFTKKGDIITG